MGERKSAGAGVGVGADKTPSRVLALVALGFFLATYNLVTSVVRDHRREVEREPFDATSSSRPAGPGGGTEGSSRAGPAGRPFHVAVTAGAGTYNQWQCRIMYYWYKKVKDSEGSEMGGFTRVLHSGKPDHLMDEIPTFVVDPLPDGLDRGYIVLNRPWAFVQWLEKAMIKEDYILMAEPDHIFVNPLPNLAIGTYPAGFPFPYMSPGEFGRLVRKFYPEDKGPLTDIEPIGNSPVIILKSQLEKIAPTWMTVSMRMKDDPETDKAWGWILEMFAYAVASALHGLQHVLHQDFMIHPPWDLKLGKSFIIHYTYGCDFPSKGELSHGKKAKWHFDKRSYDDVPPPRNLSLPPPGAPESVVTLIKMINEATANIPGWDNGKQ